MRYAENIRIAAIAIGVLLAQLIWITRFPNFGTLDVYIIFLLLLAAARGPLYGGIHAILGGALMDSFSAQSQFVSFHTFYYMLPVMVGVAFRSRMLLQYRQVAALALALLLILKVVAQFALASMGGLIASPLYLFRINYLPLAIELALVYIFWARLSELIPEAREGRRLA